MISAIPEDSEAKHNSMFLKPLMMVLVGKTGAGKTSLLIKMLLTVKFLDYNNLIIFPSTIEQKDYLLLRHGFKYNLSKSAMLSILEILPKYKDKQIEVICEAYKKSYPDDKNDIPITVIFYEYFITRIFYI
jgi:hypothetical protein